MPTQIKLPRGTIVPNHIAVILDGNGRWARSRGLPVTQGHEEGAKAIKRILETSRKLGVHTLTIWGFSTENWKRPPQEVHKILNLVKNTIKAEINNAHEQQIRFVHIGRKDKLPLDLLRIITKAEEETKDYKKHILNVALDYGGRDEILRAVKRIINDDVPADKITEDLFSHYLDTADQPYPYPDLFIRTSGEQRTSGLMPWQTTYSEFYFEEDHLPDMTPEKLVTAILDYSRRRRRFGGKDKAKHFRFRPAVIAQIELDWWRLSNIPEDKSFSQYAVDHIKEQWGVSAELAKGAAVLMVQALKEGEKEKWGLAQKKLKAFYLLIKEEVQLAFEPSIAASLQVKLLQKLNGGLKPNAESEIEETTRQYLSEVYRISEFQARKAAHLRMLATAERRLAETNGNDEYHWLRAQDYLEAYYKALKDRIA